MAAGRGGEGAMEGEGGMGKGGGVREGMESDECDLARHEPGEHHACKGMSFAGMVASTCVADANSSGNLGMEWRQRLRVVIHFSASVVSAICTADAISH